MLKTKTKFQAVLYLHNKKTIYEYIIQALLRKYDLSSSKIPII